jgi:hypothetical protein
MSRLARQPENGPRAYSSADCPRLQPCHSLTNWPLQPLYKSLAVMTSCSESQPCVCPVTDLQRICS